MTLNGQEDCSKATITNTIASYEKLASDLNTRQFLIQDDVCIQFLAYVLEDEDTNIVLSSLRILKLLSENVESGSVLSKVFGVTQALECLLDTQKQQNGIVREEAKQILDRLRSKTCNTTTNVSRWDNRVSFCVPLCEIKPSNRDTGNVLHKELKSGHGGRLHSIFKPGTVVAKTIVLQIQGLVTKGDRKICENVLVKVTGVISLTFDMNKKRCILRTKAELAAETLINAISRTDTMIARLVVKNEDGREVLTDVSLSINDKNKENEEDLPLYLSESESPEKSDGKAMTKLDGNRRTAAASSWFNAATNFVSKSFYW